MRPQRADGNAQTASAVHEHLFERPVRPLPGPRRLLRDAGGVHAANGLIGLVFAATGPVAVILAVGAQGGLSQEELASWIFGAFFLNGVLTVVACWLYRQPLAFFWTIPGTVLVGPALTHLAWGQVVGAFFLTGVLVLLLGLTGWVRRAMAVVPMPIVMAMVAGVFLRFGVDLVRSLREDVAITAPMIVTFLALSALPGLGRRVPPVLGALAVGAVAVGLSGRFRPSASGTEWFAAPVVQVPQWSVQAALELVVPLAITVLVVQNGQGVAVLRAAGHEPPVNTVTIACGAWSLLTATVGTVSTCLTGPTNALLSASGARSRQYTAGIVCGLLAMVFGLLAPLVTGVMLATPVAFVATLGGLAMLRVLQAAFVTAFSTHFTLGALVTFVVTVSDVSAWNVGAPFWGLLAGLAVSWLLERPDHSDRGSVDRSAPGR
ncbi:benzoate/H(+) symporter BenE family transporter [Geodermatophilus sp. YIM 151500]|uniref:benzoate/H(+) symporter BenE family transporter n=1 Tax=Geodermatophilus sp. YIM 151500 TaxID=2984531 RepID=UPI0021E39A84|nr:benzoate/H(+) symporter BenE family transporter [Geodermatophilus sp. YIM 151500]MCV2489863.1 benzoate/H(+) symporter BenE family transporter [Geodermatophilus sp. YIM 151500]